MNWVDIVWPMISASSLTLAVIYLFVWLRQRQRWPHLLFALAAASVSAVALIELAMMRTTSVEHYEALVRWAHVPTAILAVCIVAFIRLQYQAGNVVLACIACISRIACLIPNFLFGANLNYADVRSLERFRLWGSDISITGSTVANPWMLLGNANALLIAAFIVTALLQIGKRPKSSERTRAIIVCLAMACFVFIAGEWAWLVVHDHVQGPLMFSPAFLGVLAAMGYEVGTSTVRAGELAQDLSDTRRHLRDSEQRMAHAVTAAGVGLWHWDIAAHRIWLSPQARTLLGADPEREMSVDDFLQRLHPSDRRRFEHDIHTTSGDTSEFDCEYRVLLPDGSTRWIVSRGQIVTDDSGAPLRLDGVLGDITERKDSESRFRLVVESTPGGLLVVDPRGKVVLANREAGVVFGHDIADLVGMDIDVLLPTVASQRDDRRAATVIGTGQEQPGHHRSGAELPLMVMLNPVPFESELCVLVSVTDLSEKRRAEREAATQRDELAHLSRVALLTELSGSLAHELNQPLAAILANAQAASRFLARNSPDLDEIRDSLAAIVDNDKRAAEVIRRMRALLRKDSADYRRLDLNEVIEEVLQILHSDLLNRQVQVEPRLAAGLPAVRGDSVQLQQVVLNLVMNACDAMAASEEPRRVTLQTREVEGGWIEVAVRDTGSGIPAQDLEHVFSPFFTSKRDGLGLGLALCLTIIQAHGGEIRAENNPGSGATIVFRLPVIAGPVEAPVSGPTPRTPADPQVPAG